MALGDLDGLGCATAEHTLPLLPLELYMLLLHVTLSNKGRLLKQLLASFLCMFGSLH